MKNKSVALGDNLVNQDTITSACERLAETLKKKNVDYGNSVEASFRKRGPEIMAIRIEDKLNRFENLTDTSGKDAQVSDESIVDTLEDLAGYAILGAILMDNGSGLYEGVSIKSEMKAAKGVTQVVTSTISPGSVTSNLKLNACQNESKAEGEASFVDLARITVEEYVIKRVVELVFERCAGYVGAEEAELISERCTRYAGNKSVAQEILNTLFANYRVSRLHPIHIYMESEILPYINSVISNAVDCQVERESGKISVSKYAKSEIKKVISSEVPRDRAAEQIFSILYNSFDIHESNLLHANDKDIIDKVIADILSEYKDGNSEAAMGEIAENDERFAMMRDRYNNHMLAFSGLMIRLFEDLKVDEAEMSRIMGLLDEIRSASTDGRKVTIAEAKLFSENAPGDNWVLPGKCPYEFTTVGHTEPAEERMENPECSAREDAYTDDEILDLTGVDVSNADNFIF